MWHTCNRQTFEILKVDQNQTRTTKLQQWHFKSSFSDSSVTDFFRKSCFTNRLLAPSVKLESQTFISRWSEHRRPTLKIHLPTLDLWVLFLKGDLWTLLCEIRSSKFYSWSSFFFYISASNVHFWSSFFWNQKSVYRYSTFELQFLKSHCAICFLNFDDSDFDVWILIVVAWLLVIKLGNRWIHKPRPPFKNQTSKQIARIKFQNSEFKIRGAMI